MGFVRHSIGRDVGAALGVLAIYLLTLLVPLHYARASQVELAELGYGLSPDGWVLCLQDGAGEPQKSADVLAKCPICQLGKTGLATLDATPPTIVLSDAVELADTAVSLPAPVVFAPFIRAQPRAPPVSA